MGKEEKGPPRLRLYNTLGRELQDFVPLEKGVVKMYNCGPTVYDYATIGNLRPYIFVDSLRQVLEHVCNYQVKQVINITDFGHLVSDADEGEDKMTKGLRREGLSISMKNMQVLSEKYAKIFLGDLEQLNIDTTKIQFPRASAHVEEQITLIKQLEEKGYTYTTASGVYFDTEKFHGYGKLGGLVKINETETRLTANNSEKRHGADFVLWKSDESLGWASPWGSGFPGWHIECTAMIFATLGQEIDIHTGGIDHISIHHNNEIAQAEAITKKPFARYWMHNEFITMDNEKISKSLGNTWYLGDVISRGISPLALRYWFMTGHYRTPMNFTWEALEASNTARKRLVRAYRELETEIPSTSSKQATPDERFTETFNAHLCNDLAIPQALASVWDMLKSPIDAGQKKTSLEFAESILNLGITEDLSGEQKTATEVPDQVRALADLRERARKAKDFARADVLRKEIEQAGYIVKDTLDGPMIVVK